MSEKIKTAADVDLEQLTDDLQRLVSEISETETLLMSLSVEERVDAQDDIRTTFTIELIGKEGSVVYDGYTIPTNE